MKKELWIYDYNLIKGQDKFVNIEVGTGEISTRAFVNPHSIMNLNKDDLLYEFKKQMVLIFNSFFNTLLEEIRSDDNDVLEDIRIYLHEAKYVNLGFGNPKYGKAFGKKKFRNLCDSIRNSPAYETGLIKNIADFSLYCKGVGDDLMSDLLVNLIYPYLSKFTESIIVESGLDKANNQKTRTLHSWNVEKNMWDKNGDEYRAFAYLDSVFLFTPLCICRIEYCTDRRMKREFQNMYYPRIVADMDKNTKRKISFKESLNYFRKIHMSYTDEVDRSKPNKTEFLSMVSAYAELMQIEKDNNSKIYDK